MIQLEPYPNTFVSSRKPSGPFVAPLIVCVGLSSRSFVTRVPAMTHLKKKMSKAALRMMQAKTTSPNRLRFCPSLGFAKSQIHLQET
jgi:hypothetical protein